MHLASFCYCDVRRTHTGTLLCVPRCALPWQHPFLPLLLRQVEFLAGVLTYLPLSCPFAALQDCETVFFEILDHFVLQEASTATPDTIQCALLGIEVQQAMLNKAGCLDIFRLYKRVSGLFQRQQCEATHTITHAWHRHK